MSRGGDCSRVGTGTEELALAADDIVSVVVLTRLAGGDVGGEVTDPVVIIE